MTFFHVLRKSLWGLGYLLHGIEQCRRKRDMLNYKGRLSHHFSKEKLVYALVSLGFLQSAWHSTKCGQMSRMSSCVILFVSGRNF